MNKPPRRPERRDGADRGIPWRHAGPSRSWRPDPLPRCHR